MDNRYTETGTIFRHGDKEDSEGRSVGLRVRKIIAEHRRLLEAPFKSAKAKGARYYGDLAGAKITRLEDGTVVVTRLNPFGLAPTLSSMVYAPASITKEPTTRIFLLHHGLLSWNYPPSFPLRVYVDSEIDTYYSGPGTLLPSQGYDHAVEELEIDGVSATWPNDPPSLDGSNGYVLPEQLWEEDIPDEIASWSSGLGILLWQSFIGSGREVAEILPVGWPSDPKQIGLVRSPTWDYWLTWTGPSGCRLAKVIPAIETELFIDWIKYEALTDQDILLLESWIISTFTLSEVNDIVTVVSDFGDIYAEGAVALTGWGWQWTYQMPKSSGQNITQAVIVTTKSTGIGSAWRANSITGHITLNWDINGNPSAATVSSNESDQWVIASSVCRVFFSTVTEVCWWFPPEGVPAVDVAGPIAAWYGRNDEIIEATWGGAKSYAAGGIGYPAWGTLLSNTTVCATGTNSASAIVTESAGTECTFTCGNKIWEARSSASRVSGEYKITVVDGSVKTTTIECYDRCGAPTPCYETEAKSCDGSSSWYPCTGDTFWQTTYASTDGTTRIDYSIETAAGAKAAIMVVFGLPRCVYGVSGTYYGSGSQSQVQGQYNVASISTHAEHTLGYIREVLWSQVRFTYAPFDISTTVYYNGWIQNDAAALIDSEQVIIPDDAGWWTTLANATISSPCVEGISPRSVLSYGGKNIYEQSGGSADWVLPSGLSEDAVMNPGMTWIGGV